MNSLVDMLDRLLPEQLRRIDTFRYLSEKVLRLSWPTSKGTAHSVAKSGCWLTPVKSLRLRHSHLITHFGLLVPPYSEYFLAQLERTHPDDLYRGVWNRADRVDDVDQSLYGDLNTYLADELLVKMDVAAMAHSIETRSPLLDVGLAELSSRIPSSL